jgi:membrane protein DedA with SNARE-associated domain
MSFGLAAGSLIAAWFLGKVPQTNQAMVTSALHHAFLALSVLSIIASVTFWGLKRNDGESISRGVKQRAEDESASITS